MSRVLVSRRLCSRAPTLAPGFARAWRGWGLILPIFLAAVSLEGSPWSEANEQYYYDVFGTEAGLPQTNVTTALQTRDGYLWVGTEGGLGRFDGVRFIAFRRSNAPAFVSHSIRCLFEDRAGNLWIGTERGLVRHRAGAFEAIGLQDVPVTAVAEDQAGAIWIGTDGCGLHVWRDGELQCAEARPAGHGAAVRCLFVDSTDRLWIGLKNTPGLVYREGEEFRSYNGEGRMGGETNAVCELPRGTLWIGNAHGVYRLRAGELTYFGKKAGLLNAQVRDIRPARGGGLWVAAGGLYRVMDTEEFVATPIPNRFVRSIHEVCEDAEGNVWLCAMAESLVRIRRAHIRSFGPLDKLPDKVIKAVAQDPSGNVWLAVQRSGVMRLARDGSVKTLAQRDGLLSTDPRAVFAARDGAVWIAYSGGLCRWWDGQVEVFPRMNNVRAVHQERCGRLWFGGDRVLAYWENGDFERVELPGETRPQVYAFADDGRGAVYVGTSTGVRRLRGRQLEFFHDAPELVTNGSVRALHVDRRERLWVGMKGRGLGVFAEGQWFNPDGLADAVADHVSAIAEDDAGRLWLGTPSGVMWAGTEELLAVAQGRDETPRLRVAGLGDGLRMTPVSSGSQPAVWKGHDEQLLFATRRGLLGIDPHDVPASAIVPPVHIEQVTIDGRVLASTNDLAIPAGAQAVAIDYTAPSFVQPNRILFQYRLKGYDKDWVQAGTRRTAYYGNLPPGTYTFQVKACNSDGVWNDRPQELRLTQAPYFYQTWWFFGGAALGALGLGLGANRWSHRRLAEKLMRLEEKQAIEKERRRIAKDLHDDIGASLTEIGLFAETARAKAASTGASEAMEFLSQRVHRLAGTLDAVVWTVNPANDSLDRVVSFIAEMFQDFLRPTTIEGRLEVRGEFPAFPLDPEERANLFLTAKEAINNLVKYSGASEARLRMRMEGGVFHLSIADDGRGFDPTAAAGSGNGLANMRSRMEELGGTFRLDAKPGEGTTVALSLRLEELAPRSSAFLPPHLL